MGAVLPLFPRGSLPQVTPGGADAAASFEEFWKAYPHKVDKGHARVAWAKALRKASPQEIIAGLHRYVTTKPVDRPWCNPGTFLNGERWADEPAYVEQAPYGRREIRTDYRPVPEPHAPSASPPKVSVGWRQRLDE